eukprot:2237721-Lingulodinium_polyedra.AAC.1
MPRNARANTTRRGRWRSSRANTPRKPKLQNSFAQTRSQTADAWRRQLGAPGRPPARRHDPDDA